MATYYNLHGVPYSIFLCHIPESVVYFYCITSNDLLLKIAINWVVITVSRMQITTDDADLRKNKKYCGTGLAAVSKMLTFYASYVHLTFLSDSSVTRSGFKITYKILSRKGYYFSTVYLLRKSLSCDYMINIIVIITTITTGQYTSVVKTG